MIIEKAIAKIDRLIHEGSDLHRHVEQIQQILCKIDSDDIDYTSTHPISTRHFVFKHPELLVIGTFNPDSQGVWDRYYYPVSLIALYGSELLDYNVSTEDDVKRGREMYEFYQLDDQLRQVFYQECIDFNQLDNRPHLTGIEYQKTFGLGKSARSSTH